MMIENDPYFHSRLSRLGHFWSTIKYITQDREVSANFCHMIQISEV